MANHRDNFVSKSDLKKVIASLEIENRQLKWDLEKEKQSITSEFVEYRNTIDSLREIIRVNQYMENLPPAMREIQRLNKIIENQKNCIEMKQYQTEVQKEDSDLLYKIYWLLREKFDFDS